MPPNSWGRNVRRGFPSLAVYCPATAKLAERANSNGAEYTLATNGS